MSDNDLVAFMDALHRGLLPNFSDITRKDSVTLEITSDYGKILAFVHEMAGTREAGEAKFRFRAITDLDSSLSEDSLSRHKRVINRFTMIGSFYTNNLNRVAYFQFQLHQVTGNLALALAANSISLLPASIINTVQALDGINRQFPKQDSHWDLQKFIPHISLFKEWFQQIDVQDDTLLLEGASSNGEEYRLTISTRPINPGTGLAGLSAQVNFRSGIDKFEDRFGLINILNLNSFVYHEAPQLGAWYSDGPIALAYHLFLPNALSGLDGIEELVVHTLIRNISHVVSGQAESDVTEYLASQKA